MEYGRTENSADGGYDDRRPCGEQCGIEYAAAHFVPVTRTEIFCQRYSEAAAYSRAEAQHKKLHAR